MDGGNCMQGLITANHMKKGWVTHVEVSKLLFVNI